MVSNRLESLFVGKPRYVETLRALEITDENFDEVASVFHGVTYSDPQSGMRTIRFKASKRRETATVGSYLVLHHEDLRVVPKLIFDMKYKEHHD